METWLRLVANIHQGGIDTLMVGLGIPDHFETCAGRGLFSSAKYAALLCSEDALRARLLARPAWRGTSNEATIDRILEYNAWLADSEDLSPPIPFIDTSDAIIERTADAVLAWLRR